MPTDKDKRPTTGATRISILIPRSSNLWILFVDDQLERRHKFAELYGSDDARDASTDVYDLQRPSFIDGPVADESGLEMCRRFVVFTHYANNLCDEEPGWHSPFLCSLSLSRFEGRRCAGLDTRDEFRRAAPTHHAPFLDASNERGTLHGPETLRFSHWESIMRTSHFCLVTIGSIGFWNTFCVVVVVVVVEERRERLR